MTALGNLSNLDPSAEWTLADLLGVLARRRVWILSSLILCTFLALLYRNCATLRYRASAQIEVRKESRGAFGLDNATADRSVTAVSDSFDDNLTLQTETGILKSDAISLEVIQRTGLESTADYFAPRTGRRAFPGKLLFWRRPLEPLSTPLADAPNRRYAALQIFARHRKVAAVPGTRLITVSYSDPDPQRAAAVVAALLQALRDYGFQSRSSDAAQAASWLSVQLANLKQQTDALDARAAALDRATGDYGDSEAHNPVLARLDTLNAALSAAESSRIVREAVWRAVESGNPELISSLSGNTAAGSATQNSFALLQSLRNEEAQAQAQLAAGANRYGENWPGVAEQQAHLATIQKSIGQEVSRLGERARSDYEVAVREENAARDAFNQQKDMASRLTGNAVTLRLARQEADESRAVYTSLLGRLEQTGVLEGLHSGDFSVVSPALVPSPDHPASPNDWLLTALSLGGGLALGGCGAIARELTDTSIRTTADLETLVDGAVFAALPAAAPAMPWYRRMVPAPREAGLALAASGHAESYLPASPTPFVEGLHYLRAALQISHSGRAPQVITVASSESGGGSSGAHSSATALGLAAVLAQHGAPTLYLDADLRSAAAPGTAQQAGLSEMLAGGSVPTQPRSADALPLLSVIHAGTRPPCPSELIASARMKSLLAAWREQYTFVVIHGPAPAFADTLVLAQQSDAVLVTARVGKTRRDDAASAWQALSRQVPEHAVLGFILEGVHGHS